jgi:anti-anti-sigma factor
MGSMVEVDSEDLEGVPVLRLRGEVDMSVVAALETQLRSSILDAAPGMVLDLTELEYLDSSGLRLVLDLASRLERHGQSLRVVVAEGSLVGNLMAMTRAEDIVPLDHSVSAALGALAPA